MVIYNERLLQMKKGGEPVNQPEGKKNPGPANRLISLAAFLMLVMLMLLISYLVYLKSNNIDIKTVSINEMLKGNIFLKNEEKEEEAVQIQYNPKDHPVFSVYKGYIVKCISDSIKFLDKDGQEVWSKTLPVANPIIKTNGVELLVTGSGSKDVYLIKDKEIKWSNKLDNNVINADISESGHVVVVHETKGYKGAVTVFNLQGGPFFTRNIAEGFVVSAKVSPKAKLVLINTLETGGVKANSGITMTDMLGNPTVDKILVEDTVFPVTWFLDDEAAVAVSDSRVVCWSKDGKLKWEKQFDGEDILSSVVAGGKNMIIAASSEGKNGLIGTASTKIFEITHEGKQTEIYSVEDVVKNIEARDDIIAVNTGREVHFISLKGKLLGKYSSKIDINEVKFFSKKEAVVITKSSVEVINIGG